MITATTIRTNPRTEIMVIKGRGMRYTRDELIDVQLTDCRNRRKAAILRATHLVGGTP